MDRILTKADLQRAVINKIIAITGEEITIEEYGKLDARVIGIMLGIDMMSVRTSRDGSGGLSILDYA